ncbi:MAG TPA: aminotransferase class III-fold pyridoxal phosphate-dependent enzyme, partial [Firmicutes bacterium]|nr:aminotransferase class III-fold pyridoxal phosphate-dependent enzyme [Bacillota bacterium]
MNTYARLPVTIVRGRGTRVWDDKGKEYLDFVSGIAVNALGHCHPAVVGAVTSQVQKLFHCSNLYFSEPQAELASLLVENSPFDKVFFCNSGAEANEA